MKRTEIIESRDGIDEIRVTRYRCQGCGRSMSRRGSLEGHKVGCWRHADNRGCGSCAHAAQNFDPERRGTRVKTTCAIGLTPVTVETCSSCAGSGVASGSELPEPCDWCRGAGDLIGLTFQCPSWAELGLRVV